MSCTLAGAVLGLGYGFRTDVLILVPVGALVLMLGVRPLREFARPRLGGAAILAPAVFIAVLVVVSAPVGELIDVTPGGGNLLTQDATEPFCIFAGLKPAGYALGWGYSDELTHSGVAAVERERDPAWDARELAAVPLHYVTRAGRLLTTNLLGWALAQFSSSYFSQIIIALR